MPLDTQKWSQWDFSSLEAWEVEHCWSYEFTWHLPGLVRRVMDWREKVPKREGQDLFEAYLSHQGGALAPSFRLEVISFLSHRVLTICFRNGQLRHT